MGLIDQILLMELAIGYMTLLIMPGLTTLMYGRCTLFVLGFVLPILWIAGAVMGQSRRGDETQWVVEELRRVD